MNCPSCEDSFSTERDMKIHHKLSHGESIAKEPSVCVHCESEFEYYPSNSEGKICSDCGKYTDNWANAMDSIDGYDRVEIGSHNNWSKGKDGAKYQKRRVCQIKFNCKCNRCGYNKNPRALQFHHKRDKVKGIPKIVAHSHSWGELLEELDKCTIICANCYIIEHTEW